MKSFVTTDDLFSTVIAALKDSGCYPSILDYGKVSSGSEGIPIKTPNFQLESVLDYGGSEGIYLDIALRFPEAGGWTTVQLAVFKTLDASDDAMRTMGVLLADFTCEARRYANAHYDELDRSGFRIYGIKADGSQTGYAFLADSLEKARARVKEFLPCEEVVKAIILDKETGEETVIHNPVEKPAYRLSMMLANMGPSSSKEWKGDPFYRFDDVDEVCLFLSCHGLAREIDLERIRENDADCENGRLYSTSWFDLEKGEHRMTSYTSL